MHGALLTIDLGAVRHNWLVQKRRVGQAVECAAVVKANAYGCGLEEISCELWSAGCLTFFVATLSEALRLRRTLPKARIAVLNGLLGEAPEFVRGRIVPVISTMEDARLWIASAGAPLPLMFQVETGLNRLGLSMGDLRKLIPMIPATAGRVTLLSQLSTSSEPEALANVEQLARFRKAAAMFDQAGMRVERSLADSAGIGLGPAFHFDLVRPGISLFGAATSPKPGRSTTDFRPALRLEAPVLQARWLGPGERVGYGGQFFVKHPVRIATVAIGFADGLPRALAGQGFGTVDGRRVPIIGKISMDLTVFDVTSLPEAAVSHGTLVTLLGPSRHLDEVALEAGTIADEILTRLGSRFERKFIMSDDGQAGTGGS